MLLSLPLITSIRAVRSLPAPTSHIHAPCSTALAFAPGQLEPQQKKRYLRHRCEPIPLIAISNEDEQPVRSEPFLVVFLFAHTTLDYRFASV